MSSPFMFRPNSLILFTATLLLACAAPESVAASFPPAVPVHTFNVSGDRFMLDGKPFAIRAAELHYPRIPKEYWDHRIKMVKALGMNTVCLYVFWNVHEQHPGVFDFSGQNDLREFVGLCRDNGLFVILRPGPYVCAEWDMGGLPWWLLRDKDIALRSEDPRFLEAVERFEKAVASQVGDLTVDKGGPIIMVQVENEYGSFGKNKSYVSRIRDLLRSCYGDVVMFQCDWSSNFLDNGLDDLLWTLNFGTGSDIGAEFRPLREARPGSPLMCSEFWSGWFDKWGAPHETRPADGMIANLSEMMDNDISFSLYMTHGGTNWGHWAGANSPGYSPHVTSYDYDAPINEQGAPTAKYHLLRELMARNLAPGDSLPPVPEPVPLMSVSPFTLTEYAPLFANLPSPVRSDSVMTFEELGLGFGSVVYETVLPALEEGAELTVAEPHDYAQVFLCGELVGVLDRRNGENSLALPETPAGAPLHILVEGTGRINFGTAIKDLKGITEKVTLRRGGEHEEENLSGWDMYPFPDTPEFYSGMKYEAIEDNLGSDARGAFRGTFRIDGVPADTFLDFSEWGKGLVYVNGHPLGRIWHIGPQQTLYTPGAWLKEGENEILVFDIVGPQSLTVRGLTAPVNDRVNPDRLKTISCDNTPEAGCER